MARRIKISSKSARLLFNGCDPDYIRDVCHASCCQSSTHPTGTMITIHPSEEAAIAALGGVVKDGLLQPKKGCKVCPFKTKEHLCGIHFTPSKPFGCIASPFTLNKSDTLIVRNRYRLLKCFNDGRKIPAYKSFRASLDLIFGEDEAQRICDKLDAGSGDFYAVMDERAYRMLKDNDAIKHEAGEKKKENRLTWVSGDRDRDALDETSRKNLAAGRKAADKRSNINGASPLPEWATETGTENMATGTSIFDPVLCELAYTWFCPSGGSVLDPFAGGSVRGIVAAYLGRKYTGVDLRAEQIAANIEQAKRIVPDNPPLWIVGDSSEALPDGTFDFVFSCPPYADLEVYSDNPQDISTMDYPEFLAVYRSIVKQSIDRLADNRFACFVVGDVRDKNGIYRNFVSDTIAAFQDAGAMLYNEAILVTAVGSLPIRVGKQFASGRKLGKTHQNVLVFVKGNPKKATEACGVVEIADLYSTDDVGA